MHNVILVKPIKFDSTFSGGFRVLKFKGNATKSELHSTSVIPSPVRAAVYSVVLARVRTFWVSLQRRSI
jgi:hypothetical protein